MSDDRPQLWVFAGPKDAGKSKLVAKYLRSRLPIVNPDVIAVVMSEADDENLNILQAGKIALQLRADLLASGHSFAIETTLSGNSELKLMRDAKARGYKVNFVF
jgi:predicted ABC-type ATPase